jgi:hypothetical protein
VADNKTITLRTAVIGGISYADDYAVICAAQDVPASKPLAATI